MSDGVQQETGCPLQGAKLQRPEISCEHVGAPCMRVRDLGPPPPELAVTPNGHKLYI